MEPGLIFLAAISAWFIAVMWVGRRSAKGHNRFVWLVNVPVVFGGLAMTWAGITIASRDLAIGGVLTVLGVITTLLVARAIRAGPAGYASSAYVRGMPEQWVDYLIWAAIGVPIILSVLLVAMAIADRFNST